jgi:NADPH:quinone reductase-like Zn-dependent oxidoreductase
MPATTPAPATMRAIVQERYGDTSRLQLTHDAPTPRIADNEVLVRVAAAGLDRGTWHLMTGRPYAMRLALGLRGPRNRVPGLDVAGTVVAVGPATSGFSVGDEVFGIGRGSFAEYTAARADKLVHKPASLTFEQSAVVPVSALTALRAVVDVGRVRAGQRVLVIGASGGVGSYAVQIAKAMGAEVTGVCSTAKLDLVSGLGADHVIDYTREDWSTGDRRYDLIIDIAGNPSLSRLRRTLTPRGTAVLTGGEGGEPLTGGLDRNLRAAVLSWFVGQRLTGMLSRERASDLARVAELIEAGQVRPSVDRVYPLEQAPEAMRRLESGEVRGKVAITP